MFHREIYRTIVSAVREFSWWFYGNPLYLLGSFRCSSFCRFVYR